MIKQHLLNFYQLKDIDALLNKNVEYPTNVIFLQTFLMELIDNFEIPQYMFDITLSPFLFTKKICSL